MNFDIAFERLIGHEGGFSNHPDDPGKQTKYGISKRSYPYEEIENLTLQRAKQIYLTDYWQAAGCDRVPDTVAFDLFDMAVNSGLSTSIKTLQRTVGAVPDGVIGPKTLMAINGMEPARLLARFNGARLNFMTTLPTFSTFGRGWAKRIAANLMDA